MTRAINKLNRGLGGYGVKKVGWFCAGLISWQIGGNHAICQPLSQTVPIDPNRIPERIIEQTIPQPLPTTPETAPESPPPAAPTLQLTPEQLQLIINNALSNTAIRYAWITNPTDRLTFPAGSYNPSQAENYTEADIRFSDSNPTVVKLTYGFFPRNDQFYWVLPDNRVVIETIGNQGGIIVQGQGTALDFRSSTSFTRALFGVQVVNTLPEVLEQITDNPQAGTFTIQSVAARLTNPEGIPAVPIQITSGVNPNDPNVTILRTGTGNTNSPVGGIPGFDFLEATNTPQVLQAYPTVNLQPLLQDGDIFLQVGTVLSEESLSAINFSVDSVASSDLGGVSSLPAIKVLQAGKFDNPDLLKILTDPTLDRGLRQFYYLNSLFWADLGLRTPEETSSLEQAPGGTGNNRWYRLYFNRPFRQALLKFDPEQPIASFTEKFSSPGISISFSPELGRLNAGQSLNQTLGLGLGLAFQFLDPYNLQEQVDLAKEQRNNLQRFSPLQTTATPEQRRQINSRLNNSLFFSNLSTGLEQISGSLTFAGQATPNTADLWQVRTGLLRRVVQFTELNIDPVIRGDNTVSLLQLTDDRFGPLTFIGAGLPQSQTGFAPNQSFASEVVITAPDGQQFVQSINSTGDGLVTIPIGINRLALAFDRIEITRVDRLNAQLKEFSGSVSLPAVELSHSHNNGDLTYSVSSGLWFNTAPNSAGNVDRNDLGQEEPALGLYASAFATINSTSLEFNENKQLVGVTTTAPLVRFFVTNANNNNNSSFLSLSYTYARQIPDINFSIVPGLVFGTSSDLSQVGTTPFVQGSFALSSGLQLRTNLEFGSNYVWSLDALQQLDPNWALGAFYRNFREINVGTESRDLNTNTYGLTTRYQVPQSSVSIEGQLGFGGNNLDLRIRGNLRF